MSVYFYKLENGGNWVLGPTKTNIVKSNYFVKNLRLVDNVWKVGITDPKDNSEVIPLQSVDLYKKENGQPYLSIEELNRVTEEFFSEVSINKVLKYVAFITQTNTEDPIANVLEDSIGGLVWERVDVGTYSLTREDGFPVGKTVPYRDSYVDNDGNFIKLETMSLTELRILTSDDTDTLSDSILYNQYFKIEIYL